MADDNILWGLDRLTDFIGCSKRFTHTLIKDGGLPVHRVGGVVYALADEVMEWLRVQDREKAPAAPEPEAQAQDKPRREIPPKPGA